MLERSVREREQAKASLHRLDPWSSFHFSTSKLVDLAHSGLQNMTPHVCIVVARVSGLQCATLLLEQSYDVTIIEAR